MASENIVITGLTISDWLMILAVLLGPILAVQIQKFIERKKEKREKKLQVFRDLMTTRSLPLAYQHVSALNMVGIEFNESKDRKVIDTWKTYLDHLQSYPQKDEGQQKIWADKKNDQLSDLLYEMSQSLGFDFDKVHIKKAGYTPQAYEDQELANNFIRHQLVDILLGKKHFPMSIEKFPVDDEALKVQKDLHVLMKEHFEGKRSIPVSIDNSER